MSLLGQNAKFRSDRRMSAFAPKADISRFMSTRPSRIFIRTACDHRRNEMSALIGSPSGAEKGVGQFDLDQCARAAFTISIPWMPDGGGSDASLIQSPLVDFESLERLEDSPPELW